MMFCDEIDVCLAHYMLLTLFDHLGPLCASLVVEILEFETMHTRWLSKCPNEYFVMKMMIAWFKLHVCMWIKWFAPLLGKLSCSSLFEHH